MSTKEDFDLVAEFAATYALPASSPHYLPPSSLNRLLRRRLVARSRFNHDHHDTCMYIARSKNLNVVAYTANLLRPPAAAVEIQLHLYHTLLEEDAARDGADGEADAAPVVNHNNSDNNNSDNNNNNNDANPVAPEAAAAALAQLPKAESGAGHYCLLNSNDAIHAYFVNLEPSYIEARRKKGIEYDCDDLNMLERKLAYGCNVVPLCIWNPLHPFYDWRLHRHHHPRHPPLPQRQPRKKDSAAATTTTTTATQAQAPPPAALAAAAAEPILNLKLTKELGQRNADIEALLASTPGKSAKQHRRLSLRRLHLRNHHHHLDKKEKKDGGAEAEEENKEKEETPLVDDDDDGEAESAPPQKIFADWWYYFQPHVSHFVAISTWPGLLLCLPPLSSSAEEKQKKKKDETEKEEEADGPFPLADTVPVIITKINGVMSVLDHIFVASIEPKRFYQLPSVEYIEAFGVSVETGEPTYEKKVNK